MKSTICLLLLGLSLNISASQTRSKSKVFEIMLISDSVNSATFIKAQTNKDSYYQNLKEYEKIIGASDELIVIAEEFAQDLKNKEKYDLPIKGEDLSIMRGLMRSVLLIMEKTSFYTAINNDTDVSNITELSLSRIKLVNFLAKLNYVKLYQATHRLFVKNYQALKMAKEVAKLIDNDKNKEMLKQFTKIASNEVFTNELQEDARSFLDNRYYYLKLMIPNITRSVVLIEKFNIENNIIGLTLPTISFWSLGSWFVEIFNKFTNFISGVFGNLVGNLRFRHGYLKGHQEATRELYQTLRPLDIIAEKTPFAATDFFIPGHFGHIAVYLGTQEQLEEVGLWNHPSITPLQKEIAAGKIIIESIRPGSRLVSLEDFLEIDEITIVRDTNILRNSYQKNRTLKIAIEQLGKDYDFNFDVSTLDKVVCSEVPYHAFGHKRWQTSYILGRNTISPDQIIENAYTKGSGLKFVASIKADKEGQLEFISKHDMAYNLSFGYDYPQDVFTKKEKTCRLVRVKNNINRQDHFPQDKSFRYFRKCKTTHKPLIYSNR